MSYEDQSEGVAADFRDALSELTMNSRVEITTLTVIARENTEYAHSIAEVLQEHIKKVSLAALYIYRNTATLQHCILSRTLQLVY